MAPDLRPAGRVLDLVLERLSLLTCLAPIGAVGMLLGLVAVAATARYLASSEH